MDRNRSATVTATRPAGDDHQVLEVTGAGGRRRYRRAPCSDCPWRVDATGVFPAEAFRHSAATAYDMSERTFGCHQSGAIKPATCAGFLLRSDHNLAVRLAIMRGDIDPSAVSDGGVPLHKNYRAMAIANGVGEEEAVIRPCR